MLVDWSPQTAPTDQGLFGVDFLDVNCGWVAGNGGVILHTTDGGQVWTPEDSGTPDFLRCVCFQDAAHGWAAGFAGTILSYLLIGDFDKDADVDLEDYAHWDDCMTGPDNGPIADGCEPFDSEPDDDVDLRDFAEFQVVFGG
jgi:photosystem II stability/assembly factor-like uncharacterized protein